MILRLINFKCHTRQDFDFGNSGICLLSGASGVGKSSVIQAIYFALYGTGSKIVSYGKTKCEVHLFHNDLRIVRKKGPNSLLVNDKFHEAEGQSIINKYIGDYFNISGYIPQNPNKSFVLMNAQDKMNYLEKFAFNNVDIEKIKKKNKDYISQYHEGLICIVSRLELLDSMLEEKNKPVIELIDGVDSKLNDCEYELKQTKNNIAEAQLEIESARNMLLTLSSSQVKAKMIQDSISNIHNKYDTLSSEYIGDDKFNELQKKLGIIEQNKKFKWLEGETEKRKCILEEFKKNETLRLENLRCELKRKLWKDYNKEELTELIDEQISLSRDIEEVDGIRKKLDDLSFDDDIDVDAEILEKESVLQNAKQKSVIYKCPSCEHRLRIDENILVMYKKNDVLLSDDRKHELQQKVRKLNKIKSLLERKTNVVASYDESLPTAKDVTENLNYLRGYLRANETDEISLQKTEYNIAHSVYPDSYLILKKEIEENESELSGLKYTELINEDSVEGLFKSQLKVKEDLQRVVDDISVYNQREKEYDIPGLENKISTLNHTIGIKTQDIVSLQRVSDNLDNQIKRYNVYIVEKAKLDDYTVLENQILDLQKKERDSRKKYESMVQLQEMILECESEVFGDFINQINNHAEHYINSFFESDPMSARLIPYKMKTNKPQINFDIHYKNMDCDINMLSGGELARLVLAYTLALGEMFSVPLVMLDESTSSLDEETANDVFETINDSFKDKLVIVVAHQIVTGAFDKIINL